MQQLNTVGGSTDHHRHLIVEHGLQLSHAVSQLQVKRSQISVQAPIITGKKILLAVLIQYVYSDVILNVNCIIGVYQEYHD